MARLRVATFNAGLLVGGVPWAAERVDAVVDAVARLDADIVSLQEVWEPGHRDRISAAVAGRFSHVMAADPLPPEPGDWGLGGNCGVMLLSRLPMAGRMVTPLTSTIVRRAVLGATVTTRTGPVGVLATHLSAVLRSVAHRDGEGGWSREHLGQCKAVAGLAVRAPAPVVLAGDLNCGPGRGGPDELPASYRVLRAAFEHSPYADDRASACTWCADNPLVLDGGGQIIDHVLASGLQPAGAWRALDQPLELVVNGRPVAGALSDHSAVVVAFDHRPLSGTTRER